MSKKILIVDDNKENIQIIVSIFEKYNSDFELFIAPDGNMALKIAKKIIPDIIISDWDMPAINGIELIKNLKRDNNLKNIPVIMATGVMTSVEYLQIALEAGAADYIKKPIDEVELIARTQSALKSADYNNKLLDKKNQELIENTLFLIRNNEFNKKIVQKLENLNNLIKKENIDAKNIISEISTDIDEKLKTDSWKRFEIAFNAVYEDFYQNLLKDFNNLTPTEMKMCAFLKLGMSSKDISAVLFITPESVKVARSRLRKKLSIDVDVNLMAFLAKY